MGRARRNAWICSPSLACIGGGCRARTSHHSKIPPNAQTTCLDAVMHALTDSSGFAAAHALEKERGHQMGLALRSIRDDAHGSSEGQLHGQHLGFSAGGVVPAVGMW